MKKRYLILGGSGVVLILAAVLSAVLLRANSFRHYEYILPNVTCENVDLSGMTYEEAQQAIAKLIDNKRVYVDLMLPGENAFRINPEQTVSESIPGTALSMAWNYGREDDSLFGAWKAYRKAKDMEMTIPMQYNLTYSEESVASQVKDVASQVDQAPTPCTGSVDQETHTAEIQLGQQGRYIDQTEITQKVCEALDQRLATVEAEFIPVPLNQDDVRSLIDTLAQEGNVEVTDPMAVYLEEDQVTEIHMGLPGYSLDTQSAELLIYEASDQGQDSVSVPLTEHDPKDYDLQMFYDWVRRDAESIYYLIDGELVGGTNGYDFDLEQAETALSQAGFGDVVTIPLKVTEPLLSQEDAEACLFRDRLGRSDTYHTGEYARTTNLRLACQAIDGTVINPGEEFSFNDIVGERTAAKGYMNGIVYVNNSQKPELGGGICQVATTCYMAALKAGMTITERAEHLYQVTYCPGGLDATVYWGSLDFRFQNPWNMPIRVNASVSDGQVHISIDGSNFTGQYIELTSSFVSSGSGKTTYEASRIIYNADGSVYDTEYLGTSTYKNH